MKYSSPHLHVKAITPLTNQIAEVYYGVVDAALGQHKRSQTVLYSFITAWSRISMMRDMLFLMSEGGEDILYRRVIFSCDKKTIFTTCFFRH